MSHTDTNLVDIRETNHTLSAWVGQLEVLSIHTTGSWFIASEDATLADIIRCAVTLQNHIDERRRSA